MLNKRRLVVPARFITTLKNKIYKNVASAFENIYIDKLPEIVKKKKKTENENYRN